MTISAPMMLGIDWGTSNRRAYVLDPHGQLLLQHTDDAGILQVDGDFKGSLKTLLQTLQLRRADIVLSGMVGSRNGWQQVPYLDVGQPLSELQQQMTELQTGMEEVRCRIVPGYEYIDSSGMPDVLRGEETQVLGALQQGAPDGWFLLPGTHSKWVRVAQGRIEEFLTFMTGELYGLMTQHGTLSKVMADPMDQTDSPDAFAAGVRAAPHGTLTHMAFCCRALVVTDRMPATQAASFLSGLLIGTELHDIRQRTGHPGSGAVQIIGSAALAERYLVALELMGETARVWDPDAVYVAALQRLFSAGEVQT